MDMEKEVSVTVKLVFNITIPDTINTPDSVLAEHLVNKLSVDAKWAAIKNRTVIAYS